MIDLSYKPKPNQREENSTNSPIGLVILAVLPFVIAFWALIEHYL